MMYGFVFVGVFFFFNSICFLFLFCYVQLDFRILGLNFETFSYYKT